MRSLMYIVIVGNTHGLGVELMQESRSPGLSFFLNEETGDLHARFDPAGEVPAPDLAAVQQAMRDDNWNALAIDETALIGFVLRCRSVLEASEQVIGARRDGEFALVLSDDLMSARLTVVAAQGGEPVSEAQVLDAVRDQGIVHGLLAQQVNAALMEGHCEPLVIAGGDPPIDGTPARFECLFMEPQNERAARDENAILKYSELSHLLLVHPGDRLMRRIAPIAGTNGTDIKGRPVLAKAIPDLPFGDFQGAAPDSKDPNLLRATLAGQPMLVDNGVIVNPVIEVTDVDLGTGNIDFEGTIRVNGDVKSGMRINVAGDVHVTGTVEAAHITAGGNVAVQGGIIGHADTHTGAQSLPASTARIICQGSVQALFMEHVHVEAGAAILIDRSARQCELLAKTEIIVGAEGSRISQIIGGLSQASMLIKASVLGSSTGTKTQVQVGFDPFLDEQLQQKEKLRAQKFDELDRILKLMSYFQQNPNKAAGDVGAKVEATRIQVLCDINGLSDEIKHLSDQTELMEQGRVEAGKTIHYGVEARIGQQIWQAPDDMGGAVIRIEDGKIVVGN